MAEKKPEIYIGKEEMEASLEKLEKDLKQTVRERDKALKKLNRLKQQLFEKESEMVKDSKIIKGLRDSNENLRAHIGHLNADLELVGLKNEVASLKSTVDGKNVELSKLQTALGCAEKEFKEHLERELASVRRENKQLKNSVKKGNAKLDFTCASPCFSFRFVPASVASHVDPVAAAAATKPPDSDVPAAAYWEAAAYSDPRGDVEPLWDELFPKHDSQDSCSIM